MKKKGYLLMVNSYQLIAISSRIFVHVDPISVLPY